MVNEATNRNCYLVYYNNKRVIDVLKDNKVHIVYTSRKMNYAVCYFDKDLEGSIKKSLYKTKGFRALHSSLSFNDDFNLKGSSLEKE